MGLGRDKRFWFVKQLIRGKGNVTREGKHEQRGGKKPVKDTIAGCSYIKEEKVKPKIYS